MNKKCFAVNGAGNLQHKKAVLFVDAEQEGVGGMTLSTDTKGLRLRCCDDNDAVGSERRSNSMVGMA